MQWPSLYRLFTVYLKRTQHPVIVTIRDNKDYIRVLFYSYIYHYYRVGGPPTVYLIQGRIARPPTRIR